MGQISPLQSVQHIQPPVLTTWPKPNLTRCMSTKQCLAVRRCTTYVMRRMRSTTECKLHDPRQIIRQCGNITSYTSGWDEVRRFMVSNSRIQIIP